MIESLEISGFRNFPKDRIFKIDFITEGFILVGGHNARGKTSVYLSLGFVFAGTKGIFNHYNIRNLVNYDSRVSFARVKVKLRNMIIAGKSSFPGIKEEFLTIERIMGKNDSSNDKIIINNDKVVTSADLRSLLRQAHIDADNPYQFVGQGQLASIINKEPEERLNLLDIFIPASETGQKFLEGLRQIKNAKHSLQILDAQELQYQREEFTARELRDKYEKKLKLESRIFDTKCLWAFLLNEELLRIKNNIRHDLDETNRKIRSFSDLLGRDTNDLKLNQIQLEEIKKKIKDNQGQRNKINREIIQIEKEKSDLERKMARLLHLKEKLGEVNYINLQQAQKKLEIAESNYVSINNEIKDLEENLKELTNEIQGLEKKELTPPTVSKALLVARKLGILACYTFDNVEWAISNPDNKKRLELILSPLQYSITVSSYKDAQKLLESNIKIPIVVAHNESQLCDFFQIKGSFANSRSAVFNAIEKEWSPFQNEVLPKYDRQLTSLGSILNLISAERRIYYPFIGTEGIKMRKSQLNEEMEKIKIELHDSKENLGQSEKERSFALSIYDLAKEFDEFEKLKNQHKDSDLILKNFVVKLGKLKETDEIIIAQNNKNHGECVGLYKIIKDLKEKSEKFEKNLQEIENSLPNLKSKCFQALKEYETHYNQFPEEIANGAKLISKEKIIGTATGYQRDIERLQEELNNIGEVAENAIEEHDKAKKRLEKFRYQAEQQRNVVDIDPEKVKEDILQYERALKQFINLINKNLLRIMNQFDGEARLELERKDIDEEKWEYKPGLKIFIKFKGRDEIEVDKNCSLSGGEKTRLVVALLIALIHSQEQRHTLPFLILDEFDAQLDEPGHKMVMNLLKDEVGAKQLIIFSPNRLRDKALVADMIIAFTNRPESDPEINVMAIRQKEQ